MELLPVNPLVGRRVRLERDGRVAVVKGLVIDSFYADDFYRLVVEIEEACPSLPSGNSGHHVAVFPIGNGRTAFAAFMLSSPNASKLIIDERDLRCTIIEVYATCLANLSSLLQTTLSTSPIPGARMLRSGQ
jgi:hypothetical protein